MKQQDLRLWQFCGFAFTSIGGTLLHFLYDLTGQSTVSALISGVNESTWEHMKLLFFPLLFFAVVEAIAFREKKGFAWVKLAGTVAGLLFIPALFYTANGAFGKTPDWFNILIFFLSAALVFLLETRLFERDAVPLCCEWLAWVIFLLIGLLFVLFTFFPPSLPLFCDPISGKVGR